MPRQDTMYLFLRALRRWTPYIIRKAYLTELVVDKDGDSVVARGSWKGTAGTPAGTHTVILTRERVLGVRGSNAPLQQTPQKGICKFADDVVREILTARKVI